MKYSTWIILLSILNVITVFSGLPTGAKKIIIVITTLAFLFLAFVLRAIEKKQQAKIDLRKREIEEVMSPEMDEVVEAVAEDVHDQVEEEIQELSQPHINTYHDDEPAI